MRTNPRRGPPPPPTSSGRTRDRPRRGAIALLLAAVVCAAPTSVEAQAGPAVPERGGFAPELQAVVRLPPLLGARVRWSRVAGRWELPAASVGFLWVGPEESRIRVWPTATLGVNARLEGGLFVGGGLFVLVPGATRLPVPSPVVRAGWSAPEGLRVDAAALGAWGWTLLVSWGFGPL